MDRFVPLNKKSKKEQKKYHAMQRHTWNGLNPVTRTVPNGKGYDRNKWKNEARQNGRGSGNDEPAVLLDKYRNSKGVILSLCKSAHNAIVNRTEIRGTFPIAGCH